MKTNKKIILGTLIAGLCIAGANQSVNRFINTDGNMLTLVASASDTNLKENVEVTNWKRRIYKVDYTVAESEDKAYAIRIYAGKNFHIVDGDGNILGDDTVISTSGNLAATRDGGVIARDENGWYVEWLSPDLTQWGTHTIYFQADSDFVGGNNIMLGLEDKSGIYTGEGQSAGQTFDTCLVNVASEVEAVDTVIPIMKGMDLSQYSLQQRMNVKLNSIYGELEDLPITAQWYLREDGGESKVGEPMTRTPFELPESETKKMTSEKEYILKIYYDGETATDESTQNSSGYFNEVSTDMPMTQAVLKNEMITGTIKINVNLEYRPYDDGKESNIFKFDLYKFDAPNQVITDDTPYQECSVAFERNSDTLTKTCQIDGLEDGWYTVVPCDPEGYFVEKTQQRLDNCYPISRSGSNAGIDVHIGEILDDQYMWEVIRYQGQNTTDVLGNNFFNVSYSYKETVYPVYYRRNCPEDVTVNGIEPTDDRKYPIGSAFDVKDNNGMTADHYIFAGWSYEQGDGIYSPGETIMYPYSVHGIQCSTQATMSEDGLVLYGQWMPVYKVSYFGNTNSSGDVPADVSGTVSDRTNLYFSGDKVRILGQGTLVKQDADGTKYVFDGWSINQDGTGTRYQEGSEISITNTDLSLYAQWRAVSTDKYAVNYIASVPDGTTMDGVLPMDSNKYEEGSKVTVMDQGSMSVASYRFAGWALSSREDAIYQQGEELYGPEEIGKTVTKQDALMRENGLNFYSRWIPLYHIEYHSNTNNSNGVPVDQNAYEKNDIAKILSAKEMVREGYHFLGWNTEKDGSGQSYDAAMKFNMPDENLVLYAQWQKDMVEETDGEPVNDKDEEHNVMIPMVILSIIAVVVILAFIVYQWYLNKRK